MPGCKDACAHSEPPPCTSSRAVVQRVVESVVRERDRDAAQMARVSSKSHFEDAWLLTIPVD